MSKADTLKCYRHGWVGLLCGSYAMLSLKFGDAAFR